MRVVNDYECLLVLGWYNCISGVYDVKCGYGGVKMSLKCRLGSYFEGTLRGRRPGVFWGIFLASCHFSDFRYIIITL